MIEYKLLSKTEKQNRNKKLISTYNIYTQGKSFN